MANRTVAIYVRVSTDKQDTDNQLPALRQLCEARWPGVDRDIYEETGSALKHRPVWDSLMTACRKGQHTHVVVWALDRVGRSLQGNLGVVLELDRLAIPLVSYTESWLTMEGPARSLLVSVMSWVAEQERVRLVERTKAGQERARKAGKHMGRAPAVDPDLAVQMRARGLSMRAIGETLGCSHVAVLRALKKRRGTQVVVEQRDLSAMPA